MSTNGRQVGNRCVFVYYTHSNARAHVINVHAHNLLLTYALATYGTSTQRDSDDCRGRTRFKRLNARESYIQRFKCFAMDRFFILLSWYVSFASGQATEFDVAPIYLYPLPVGAIFHPSYIIHKIYFHSVDKWNK